MGACCTTQIKYRGRRHADDDLAEKEGKGHQQDLTTPGPNGDIVRLQGSSSFISMYTRKGKKGINQDSMTVWEVHTLSSFHSFSIQLHRQILFLFFLHISFYIIWYLYYMVSRLMI